MSQEAYAAYKTTQKTSETVRETEARALLSCASILEEARQEGLSRKDFNDAIRHNQKLWTLFQVSLCEPDNPLPRDLKTTLLNLSIYVDKTSFRAITEQNRELLKSLISINRTLAAGLAQKQGATPPQAQSAPPPAGTTTSGSITAVA